MKSKSIIIAFAVLALFSTARAQSKSGVYVFNSTDNKVEVFPAGLGLSFDENTNTISLDFSVFPFVALTGDYNDLLNKPVLTKGDKGDRGCAGATGPQGPAGPSYNPNGASGSFVSMDGKTVTVSNGIITSITMP